MKYSYNNNLAVIPITFTRWKLQVQVLYRPPFSFKSINFCLNVKMKKFLLIIFAFAPLIAAANISFEEKIDFIIDQQTSNDIANEIKEITIIALEQFDIDVSDLEDFDAYFNQFFAEYLDEMKAEIKNLYLDTYSEEEISAYYQFISQDAGSSFIAKQASIASDSIDIGIKVGQRMMSRLNNRLIRDYPELFEDLYE